MKVTFLTKPGNIIRIKCSDIKDLNCDDLYVEAEVKELIYSSKGKEIKVSIGNKDIIVPEEIAIPTSNEPFEVEFKYAPGEEFEFITYDVVTYECECTDPNINPIYCEDYWEATKVKNVAKVLECFVDHTLEPSYLFECCGKKYLVGSCGSRC